MANDVAGTLPVFTGHAHQCLDAAASTVVAVAAPMSIVSTVAVVINESVGLISAVTTINIRNVNIPVGIVVADSVSVLDTISVLVDTIVELGLVPDRFGDPAQVWAFNTETGASSRYAGYAFNSYGVFCGRYIGAKADGLYLLEGDTDAGTPIESMLDFGDLDFGTDELKHVPGVYLGIGSDGYVYLKVLANGEEYVYRSRSFESQQHQERVTPGLGLRSNLFGFELYGNGAHFDLRSVSFLAVPTKRRVR